MKIDAYYDPGHGWGKVPRKTLAKLGIITKISPYSYQRKDSVYLEEDCDWALFARAAKDKGLKISVRYHSTDRSSKIRSYRGFELSPLEKSIYIKQRRPRIYACDLLEVSLAVEVNRFLS